MRPLQEELDRIFISIRIKSPHKLIHESVRHASNLDTQAPGCGEVGAKSKIHRAILLQKMFSIREEACYWALNLNVEASSKKRHRSLRNYGLLRLNISPTNSFDETTIRSWTDLEYNGSKEAGLRTTNSVPKYNNIFQSHATQSLRRLFLSLNTTSRKAERRHFHNACSWNRPWLIRSAGYHCASLRCLISSLRLVAETPADQVNLIASFV